MSKALISIIKSQAQAEALVSADNDEAKRIKEILENADAQDVSITGEEDVSDSEKSIRINRG